MPEPRTFKIKSPQLKGSDVESWEKELKELFHSIGIDAPIIANGVYGDIDRSYTKSFVYAIGMDPAEAMAHGVTPNLRTFLRHWKNRQTPAQAQRMADRKDWRRRLRERYRKVNEQGNGKVSVFMQKILQDSWGYHPGIHDGIDLISLPDVPLFAPVRARVFDVRSSNWWRLGAPRDPKLRAKGDGIVQIELLETVGPFKEGYHIGFGHAEKAIVRSGQVVKAGQQLARTGFANAWHAHLVYNDGSTTKGIGNRDPRAIVDYAEKHG